MNELKFTVDTSQQIYQKLDQSLGADLIPDLNW